MSLLPRRIVGRVSWARVARVLRRLGSVLEEERPALATGLLGALGVALADLARPWPLKMIVDHSLLGREGEGAGRAVTSWMVANPGAGVVLGVAALVGIAGIRSGAAFVENVAFVNVAHRLVYRIRCRLYGHIQRLSMDFHDTHATGDVLTRLTGDVHLVGETLSGSILAAGSTLLALLGTGIVLALMDPVLTLAALAVVPLLFLAMSRLGWRLRRATRRQRRSEAKLVSSIHEVLKTSKLIQVLGRESAETRKFDRAGERALRVGLRVRRLQVAVQATSGLVLALGTGTVLAVGCRRVAAGALTPGDLIVFLAYVDTIRRPVIRLSRRLARLTKAVACGERIVSVLERTPRVRDEPGAREAPEFRGEVEFERVTFGYAPGRRALRNVSFRVEAGERVVLAGSVGSGKSTIVNLLLRLYDPSEGRVLIDGQDVRSFTIGSLRRQMGTVLQEELLFGLTIHENIAFACPDASRESVEEAAKAAQVHDFVVGLPDGYDTRIGEEGCTLSGGQRRLLSIARAILAKNPLLILDEPSAGLDAGTEARMASGLEAVTRGRTTLVIAHRPATVVRADRILFLHDGEILADGTHEDLCRTCERYRRRWESRLRRPGQRTGVPASVP